MTRKQDLRHHRRAAQAPSMGDPGSVGDAPAAEATAGEVIRHAREVRRESLAEVAAWLRIRESYLEAIESGRYNELPGQAYAVGFVRAYANYLGLDGEEMVRRFKQEGAVQDTPQNLHFPAPAPERNVPASAIMAAVLLVAAAGYAGWSYYDATHADTATSVPELPGRLLAMLNDGETAADDGNAAASASDGSLAGAATGTSPAAEGADGVASVPAPVPASASSAASASGGAQADGEPARSDSGTAPAAPASTAADPGRAEPQSVPERTVARTSGEVAASAGETSADAAPTDAGDANGQGTAPASAEGGAETSGGGAAGQASDVAALPETVTDPDGVVLGSTGDDVRVVLQAQSDAWVQIRNDAGEAVFTRVLRSGDVYRVPREDSLRLMTGNAGGLAVYVDGERVSGLGEPGEIRRDIVLAPEALMGGES